MEIVAVDEAGPDLGGEKPADRRFAGAGDAHHHDRDRLRGRR
jgi:hypothetical protein